MVKYRKFTLFTAFKSTVQQHQVHSHRCAAIPTIDLPNFLTFPHYTLTPHT